MTRFRYLARGADGRTRRGTREAPSELALLGTLRGSGLLVLRLDALPAAARGGRRWLRRLNGPRLSDVELELRQVAVMLRSGLPLLSALHTCAAQSPRAVLAATWREVSSRVQGGASLSEALEEQRCFPPLVTSLVGVGERTGNLDLVLERAAEALARRRERTASITAALTYPAIVLVLAMGAVAYLTTSLIPKLSVFLKGLGRSLPAPTQFLVDVSAFVQAHALAIVGTGSGLVLALVLAWFSPARRALIDPALLGLPLIGRIVRLAGTATLAHNLALLLTSGVRVTSALDVVAPLLPNERLRAALRRTRERVLAGAGLSESLAVERSAFGPLLTGMVAVGESAGTLDSVLVEVAGFHDERLAVLVRRLGTLIEPVIVIVIGSIVGFVYLAFFMAIASIAGGRG